jgi:hypothetical protein
MDQFNTNEPQQKPKSGGVLKWVLIGCGGLVLIGAIAIGGLIYMASRGMSTDTAKVEAIAQEILPFEKPDGYRGAFSMSIMGMKTAMLAEIGGNGSIMVMTFPSQKANKEGIERKLNAAMEKQGRGQAAISEKRASETFNVRGKNVVAEVGVVGGKNGTNNALRYALTLESSSGGLAMLMISGSEETTTHDWVQKLLDSVK